MSALAEALVAAQRRALTAMEKQYVAGFLTVDDFSTWCEQVGMTDNVDFARLLSCLDVIKQYGAQLPAEPATSNNEPKAPERATEAQLNFIAQLVKEQKLTAPEIPLTKEQAHEVIDSLKKNTYDYRKWTVPF